MQTRLSTRGQVVLPGAIRRKLGLQPGDTLDASVEGNVILLSARTAGRGKASIVTDPITGLPVITAGPGAPLLTTDQVREILADFP